MSKAGFRSSASDWKGNIALCPRLKQRTFAASLMNLSSHLTHPVFKRVGELADERGQRAFVIGGFVRDLLLDRPCKDIDIVIEGSGIALARATAKRMGVDQVHVFKNFGTAMFKARDCEVEFVGARKESYSRGSRKPVVEDGTIEDDQNRRDFTINAMAISLNADSFGKLVDPFGGMDDLDRKWIRTPLDPDITYSDDPLRMMRAVRFASQLGFRIEEGSLEAIRRNAKRLEIISAERIHTELNKIVASPKPSRGFKLLFKTKLLHQFFPEMVALHGVEWRKGVGHKDNFYHTLEVLDNVAEYSDSLWLRWAAIMHDIAKPPTKRFDPKAGWTFHGHEDRGARMVPKIFARLKLPMDAKMKYVQKLVLLHLRPIALTKDVVQTAIRRLPSKQVTTSTTSWSFAERTSLRRTKRKSSATSATTTWWSKNSRTWKRRTPFGIFSHRCQGKKSWPRLASRHQGPWGTSKTPSKRPFSTATSRTIPWRPSN